MFSQLGPLFKTTLLREAERTDARLEIRRHEQDEQSRKEHDSQDEQEGSFLWDDSTEVSVEALKSFLLEFLSSKTQTQTGGKGAAPRTQHASDVERTPANPIAERAIKAYGVSAAHAAPPTIEVTEPEDSTQQDPEDVGSEDIRNMHGLIADLDVLSRRGVQTLTIEKADSFLEALILAVRAAKDAT